MRNYGVSKDIKESIEDAFNIELLSKIDLLKCNDFIAFNRVVIGDMHGMNRLDCNQNSRINKIKIFFNNLINIKFKSYTLTTSKEQSIQTAASGLLTYCLGSISIPANAFLKANTDYDFFIDVNKKGNASFRADGKVDVSLMAAKIAAGGGHVNARGGRFEDFKESIDYNEVKNYVQNKLDKI